MTTLNPNAAEWRPQHLRTMPSRPDSEQIIRNTYIRIIDSYRLRLEVEYQQTGNCPEQSIYNTDVDIDVAFNNVDKRDVELYAKDFRGYVRHGIWGDTFASWVSEEDDLIPIVYMAINDEIHNITKRVFILNDGNDDQVADEYYCLGVDGKRVELNSDLLDLAEQVTGRIANDEEMMIYLNIACRHGVLPQMKVGEVMLSPIQSIGSMNIIRILCRRVRPVMVGGHSTRFINQMVVLGVTFAIQILRNYI